MGNKMLVLGILIILGGTLMGGYLAITLPFWLGIGITSIAIARKLRTRHKTAVYQGA